VGSAQVKLLVDSVIFIDHFNGIQTATRYLFAHQPDIVVSVVTRAEVLTGFDKAAARTAMKLLDHFPTLAIDQQVADLAASLRRENGWKLPDAFQAALTQHHGLRLVTRNHHDFPPTRHNFVSIPYRI
jgi:predicted nucleic acid-binding protein